MALMDKLQPVFDGLALFFFPGCLMTGKQMKQRGGLMGGVESNWPLVLVCCFILEIHWHRAQVAHILDYRQD